MEPSIFFLVLNAIVIAPHSNTFIEGRVVLFFIDVIVECDPVKKFYIILVSVTC